MTSPRTMLSAAVMCLTAALEVLATPYTFTKVADNSAEFSGFWDPGINNNGEVVIQAQLNNGQQILFTDRGGVRTIVQQMPSSPYTTFVYSPQISDSGAVAFFKDRQSLPFQSGLFVGSGGPLTTIAHSSSGRPGAPSGINTPGTVVFMSYINDNDEALFAGNGGVVTKIAEETGPLRVLGGPAINDAGTIAFQAIGNDGTWGVHVSIGGITTRVYHSLGSFLVGRGLATHINDGGTLQFIAELDDGRGGIFQGSGGAVTTIVDSTGPFAGFSEDLLNDLGRAAFSATLDDGGEGVFVGPDPVNDKVIAIGDPLFGSTVRSVYAGGFNNAGEIVLEYELANGINGVAVATPVPEPTVACVFALGAIVMARRRSRRTRSNGVWREAFG